MSNNPWADGGSEGGWEDVRPRRDGQAPSADGRDPQNAPAALRPGGAFENLEAEEEHAWGEPRRQPSDGQRLEGAPAFLRPGGDRSETNPFLRKKVPQSQSQDATPAESFSKLTLDEPSTNPWQPAIVGQNAATPPPPQLAPSLLDENTKDPWAPTPQPPISGSPALVSLPSGRESPAWDEDPLGNKAKPPTPPMKLTEELTGDTHVWDEIGDPSKGKAKAGAGSASPDDWNLIDAEPSTSFSKEPAEDKPPLPPRQPTEPSVWKPSREPVDGKTETYQIKNIRWHDATSARNPRTSPILIQNANGPCPLVALVNALTMTTPADIEDTALVQILRSREQVSLNLLLDAVFDELMSPRRTSSEDALPDVSDLYAFLQSLHTGMNVNPRFIPTESMVNAYKRTSLTHLHPTERGDLIPGTFENTAEMALYATFSIPLIHGWLPPKSEPAYESLERQAASYEDAQNLLFREEELEEKLSDPDVGLTESEQQLYQDVIIIKEFLETSATQLTHWGIEVIGKAIRPGTFAILFRNDHFSTLYCHPQSMQLLTLVTDAGFKTHEEIVWETLSDVNGESTEFVSGDFRVVSLSGAVPGTSAGNYNSNDGGEWTTVHNKRGKARHEDEPPMSPSTEQEDRDLALALQLQEEEEERHRAEEARRRRESILSEQYIEQQARQTGPANRGGRGGHGDQAGRGGGAPRGGGVTRQASGLVPGRTSSSNAPTTTMANAQPRPAQQVVRSLIPPQRQGVTRPAEAASEEAPPSYEQAAQDQVYRPPVGHPSHADSSADISRQSTRTGSVSMGQRQAGQSAGRRPPVNPAAVLGNNQSQPKDRDCVVM